MRSHCVVGEVVLLDRAENGPQWSVRTEQGGLLILPESVMEPIPSTVTVTVGSQSFEVEREDLRAYAERWQHWPVSQGEDAPLVGLARAAAVELGMEEQ